MASESVVLVDEQIGEHPRLGGDDDLLVWDLTRIEHALDLVARDAGLHAVDGDAAHRDQSATRSVSMPLAAAAWTWWLSPSGIAPMNACGRRIEPVRLPSSLCSGE